MRFLLLLTVFVTLVACTLAVDYQWGEIGPNDSRIGKDKIKKRAIWGLKVSKKYVFKQKGYNAKTITAITATNTKAKYGSTAELISGGPGSKGATIRVTSKRGKRIRMECSFYGK